MSDIPVGLPRRSGEWIRRGRWWARSTPGLSEILPVIAGGTTAAFTQSHARFRNDNGTEATATYLALEDANATLLVDTNYRIRIQVDETAGGGSNNFTGVLRYSHNSGAYTAVSASSAVVRASASANLTDEEATTAQLTAPTGTFVAGAVDEADGSAGTTQIDFAAGQYTELEYCFQIVSGDVVNGDTIDFRVYRGAVVLNSYAVTIRATVSEALDVAGSFIASATQLFAGIVTAGAVAVSGATIASGAQLFPGAVIPAPTNVSGAHIASGSTLFAGTVSDFPRNATPLDDFNRANETPLAGNWSTATYWWTGPGLVLDGNQIRNTEAAGGGTGSYWNRDRVGPDPDSFVTMPALATASDTNPSVGFTITTGDLADPDGPVDSYELSFVRQSNGLYYVEWSRYDADVYTILDGIVDVPIAAGDRVGLRRTGTSLAAYVNGVVVLSVTDATYTGAFQVALGIIRDSSQTIRLDDFGAGPFIVDGAHITSGAQLFAGTVTGGGAVTQGYRSLSAFWVGGAASPTGAQAVLGATIASGSQLFAGTVTVGAVSVDGAHIASGAQLFAGTVTTGAVSVDGATIASGSQLFAGSVTVGAASVDGSTITSGAQLFAGTVTTGAVSVDGATIGSTAQLFPGEVTQGAINVDGAHLASTAQLFAGSVTAGAVSIDGATIGSGAQLFAGSVTTGAVTVDGATIGAGSQLFPGTAFVSGQLGGETIASTATLFPGTVTTGAVDVDGATIASGAQLFAGTVTLTQAVDGATIGSTAQLFSGTVTVGATSVSGAHLPSGATLFPGTVTTGAVSVDGATIASGAQLFPGAVTAGAATIGGATIPAGTQLFAGTVTTGAVEVEGAFIASTAQLFPGTVSEVFDVTVNGAHIGSTAVLFPGSVGHALDVCATTAYSLMPDRTVVSLMPVRTVVSLMPSRTVEPYCEE